MSVHLDYGDVSASSKWLQFILSRCRLCNIHQMVLRKRNMDRNSAEPQRRTGNNLPPFIDMISSAYYILQEGKGERKRICIFHSGSVGIPHAGMEHTIVIRMNSMDLQSRHLLHCRQTSVEPSYSILLKANEFCV